MEEQKKTFSFRKLPLGWILLGITLWFLFPWIFSVFFNLIIKNPKEYGESFGAVGDIYGSLNAFVSSIALCAVAYATYKQIKASEETHQANQKQLSVSEYALFSSQLYDLLNFKNERIKALVINGKTKKIDENGREIEIDFRIEGFEVFKVYHREILEVLKLEWKDKCDSLKSHQVKSMFHKISKKINNGQNFYELGNYFNLYTQIFLLIDNDSLTKDEQKAAISLVRATMTLSEQVTMFFICGYKGELHDILHGKQVFNSFYSKHYIPFALQFYDATYFESERWNKVFSENI